MTTERHDVPAAAVLDSIRDVADTLAVRRVFGEPQVIDDMTIIAVARIAGGAGGGGGEGTGELEAGGGFGTGFGLQAQPVGIYKIHDGRVEWVPTIDVTRLARGGQVLAAVITVCFTLVVLRRRSSPGR